MTNILSFPNKIMKNENKRLISSLSEINRRFWLTTLPERLANRERSPRLLELLVAAGKSPYMTNMSNSTWAFAVPVLEISDVRDGGDWSAQFGLDSILRDTLFPEYGLQHRTRFLQLTLERRIDPPPMPVIPATLLEELTAYCSSCTTSRIDTRMKYGHAILSAILDGASLQYVGHGVHRERFTVDFWHPRTQVYYVFMFDYLPLLLDDSAMHARVRQDKSPSPSPQT